ncbi:serpin family protein [Gandjariella thermophila]|uniref:Serine protease n=1 Tax=Gandjariella thermophila TaxID=1931992 RepID=A0A4D4JBU1_9PSEU|nr:serpin family protein [Gandjariella thermophila]GDY31387.1 serine protease [Gandjariella thermophila]
MTRAAQTTGRAHLAFVLALHRSLAPDPTRTACWSPYSVASALGLTAFAARGATRDELVTALLGEPGADPRALADALSAAAELPGEHGAETPALTVANTLWAAQGLAVRPEFGDELAAWPNGAARTAPFADDPEAARALINDSVAETTRGLIRQLVPPGAVGPDTLSALVNALYLRTGWRNRFPEHATAPQPFHAPDGRRDVPTMRLTAKLGYAARHGWQAVTLPAVGGVDAVVLLPDGDLATAEPELDTARLADLLDAPSPARVDLALPRLRVAERASLQEALGRLGVRRLFTKAADLGGLFVRERAYVDAVLHEAVLRIDEQGLEGAAATAVMFRMAAVIREEPPVVVRVDRPFLVLVRHAGTGAVYFLARVVAP